MIQFLTKRIKAIENAVKSKAKLRKEFRLLKTIPGIGDILSLTIMLEVQPGEGWTYAHASHDIIGYLVEKFSGMPLDKYMEKELFKPLKMNETWFYPPENVFSRIPEATQPGKAGTLYIEETLVLLPIDTQYSFGKNKTYFSGGGGLHSTAFDYFRFGQMMLKKGELDGVRVLSIKAVELMTQPTPNDVEKR